MAHASRVAPVLSTPAGHIFEDDAHRTADIPHQLHSPEAIHLRYEIDRTVAEIKRGGWKRVALQFPDRMLPDAPAVFEALSQHLAVEKGPSESNSMSLEQTSPHAMEKLQSITNHQSPKKLFILADTSYGACCVDEIAAEHVDADVVVHYGRACLSPTVRLPVIHVFTRQSLAVDRVIESFKSLFPDRNQAVILMADVTFASHLPHIDTALKTEGYTSVFTPDIVHSPSSPLPNRTVPENVLRDPTKLSEWRLFHISDPPESLLLTLTSRVSSIHVFPTTPAKAATVVDVTAAVALRRRYALLTSVTTVPIFGILINTLSVKNYLHILEHVKSCISASGRKSYTFVVGKVNAAKVANFSEIGAWVVIGCWESSLIDSKDFWKPILTPFELELALAGDDKRIWTGKWVSDFQTILNGIERHSIDQSTSNHNTYDGDTTTNGHSIEGSDSEPESAPPEFDLRTGRYMPHSRPMQVRPKIERGENQSGPNGQVARRSRSDIARIGDIASPGAEFLRSSRSWKGLGSDFQIEYDHAKDENNSTGMEEGLSGSARGYIRAQSQTKA
ncbi:Diphthamide biosynthesis protein 2 [Xanthoria parietina]